MVKMDQETTKLLLESYRPQDAGDPIFAEALRSVAEDPELGAWFEEMQQFDAVMVEKFRELPVPLNAKSHILLGRHVGFDATDRPQRRWWIPSAIAALLLAGLFTWHLVTPRAQSLAPMALQAISYTGKMPPLQFVCFNPAVVARWVNDQPNARAIGLHLPKPPESMAMQMIGSSVAEWHGEPVVMVCLQNKERMAMLYILSGKTAAGVPDGATQTMQKADWIVRSTKTDGQLRLLTTKGGPEDLNFPMPF